MLESTPAPEPLLPPLAVATFIASVAGAGTLANCAVVAALLKRTRNGLLSIIIQLAVSDIVLVFIIAPELWTANSRTWCFGSSGCTAYQGLNVFISTASLYLVTATALHTLTTINIEEKTIERKIKRTHDEDEEIRSSQHSLVANSDSSTPHRTMNVDYRVTDRRIPVTLPTVFVWVLSASLSVPEFALASTVSLGKNVVFCTLNVSHRFNVHSMLSIFILFLPLFIMSTVIVLIIIKLKSKKNLSEVDNCESVAALRLSLWLIVVNGLLCTPRSIVSAYSVYSSSLNTLNSESPIDVLQQSDVITIISLGFSSTYLTSTLIRPLLYIFILPRMRTLFSFRSKNANV